VTSGERPKTETGARPSDAGAAGKSEAVLSVAVLAGGGEKKLTGMAGCCVSWCESGCAATATGEELACARPERGGARPAACTGDDRALLPAGNGPANRDDACASEGGGVGCTRVGVGSLATAAGTCSAGAPCTGVADAAGEAVQAAWEGGALGGKVSGSLYRKQERARNDPLTA
jgi:hypothetical protein